MICCMTTWLQAHDHYHSLRHLHDKYSTTHFAPALVRHHWDFSLAIWKHRNDNVHGATADAAKETQEEFSDAKTAEAYQHPDKHSKNDRLILFSRPLPVRLKIVTPPKSNGSLYTLPASMHLIHQSTNHLPLHATSTICFDLSPHSCVT